MWDLTPAQEIADFEPAFIKIPSASKQHYEMLSWLRDHYQGQIHLSFGMTSRDEKERIVQFFEEKGQGKDLVIYACTFGYPVPFEALCLYEITRLRKQFRHRVRSIGFSGHHLGIAVEIAARTLGAEWIERHFTLDRTWTGTDHAALLESNGLRRLCRDVKHVGQAIRYKDEEALSIEEEQRDKLRWVSS